MKRIWHGGWAPSGGIIKNFVRRIAEGQTMRWQVISVTASISLATLIASTTTISAQQQLVTAAQQDF